MNDSTLSIALAHLTSRTSSPPQHARLSELVDSMIDHYVSWREECVSVRVAYKQWSCAGRSDRRLAFSAYQAALDREECAAATYQELAEAVMRETSGTQPLRAGSRTREFSGS